MRSSLSSWGLCTSFFFSLGGTSAHPHVTGFASYLRSELQCHHSTDTPHYRVTFYHHIYSLQSTCYNQKSLCSHFSLLIVMCLSPMVTRSMSVLLHSTLLHAQHQAQGLAAGRCSISWIKTLRASQTSPATHPTRSML